jgi:hypothetical protein
MAKSMNSSLEVLLEKPSSTNLKNNKAVAEKVQNDTIFFAIKEDLRAKLQNKEH